MGLRRPKAFLLPTKAHDPKSQAHMPNNCPSPPPYSLVLNGFCFLLEEGRFEGGKNVFLRPTRPPSLQEEQEGEKKLVLLFFALPLTPFPQKGDADK